MSAAAERLSRLLALVPWLIVNDGISMEAAARHFNISVTQLEDDLNLLICCGLPGYSHAELVDIQFWDDGLIHVLDPQTIGRPLRLSGDEATALLVALRMLEQIPGDHDRSALLSATVRITEAVGGAVDESVVVDAGVDARFADVVSAAIAGGDDLEIHYGGASDAVSARTIAPLRTVSHDGRTYLEAYCRSAEAVRTFRMDRLIRAQVVPSGGPVPGDAPTPEPGAPEMQAQVRVSAPWVAEALGACGPTVIEDGRIIVSVPVYDQVWLVRSILAMGGEAEVLTPAALRQAVSDAAAAALASYA